MPKAWSSKDERQYEHIKESSQKRGRSTKRAKEIAARTVNKQRKEEGRTKGQKSRGKSTSRSRTSTRGKTSTRRKTSTRSTTSRRGGGGLEDRTKDQLYAQAKKLKIQGRSRMSKRELARAIQKAS